MYCTGFHSHSASLTGSHPWCGGACLAGCPPICASSACLSPHLRAVVHCGSLFTVTWRFHSPALRQCRPVHFLWLVQKPVDLRHLPNGAQTVPVLNSTTYSRLFFSAFP